MPFLNIKEVARLFGVSEKTVYRLLNKGELPGIKIGGQWRFNHKEVESWLKNERPEAYIIGNFQQTENDLTLTLSEALDNGGIFLKIGGETIYEVLKNSIAVIYLGPQINRKELLEAVIAREKLCTTAVGQGIALPHPRHPYHSNFVRSGISLCFLENAIDFGALDNQPVNKLFFVFGKTEKEHLLLLKRLVNMLRQPNFNRVLEPPTNPTEILKTLHELETQ